MRRLRRYLLALKWHVPYKPEWLIPGYRHALCCASWLTLDGCPDDRDPVPYGPAGSVSVHVCNRLDRHRGRCWCVCGTRDPQPTPEHYLPRERARSSR